VILAALEETDVTPLALLAQGRGWVVFGVIQELARALERHGWITLLAFAVIGIAAAALVLFVLLRR
jgi:hypothetical protein